MREGKEIVDRGGTGIHSGKRGLEFEAEPLVVVEQVERDGSGATGIGGVIAKTVEHKMGVLTFVLSSTDRRK